MASCFLIDIGKCLYCGTCVIVCRRHHKPHGIKRRRLISIENENRKQTIPISCHHCAAPACMAVCEKRCIRKTRSGVVVLDSRNCTGCGECAALCPFSAISVGKDSAKADKCDLCYQRLQRGLSPYCVAACPAGALMLGDTDHIPPGYKPFLQGYYIKTVTGPSTHYRVKTHIPRESLISRAEEQNAQFQDSTIHTSDSPDPM